eukprot:TRINITY_DN26620_c0_g1_i1.p1 TRINITY_DN26620_c0_g1~~TRINITY_DN26620_c0_g1_i1.p1  ORF type:complete len:498 (-),score=98.64 TRINITY_DN26620_c0_g1_i1:46-1467(-)
MPIAPVFQPIPVSNYAPCYVSSTVTIPSGPSISPCGVVPYMPAANTWAPMSPVRSYPSMMNRRGCATLRPSLGPQVMPQHPVQPSQSRATSLPQVDAEVSSQVQALLAAWAQVKAGLQQLSQGGNEVAAEQDVAHGLNAMVGRLRAWEESHPSPEHRALLLFRFPRRLIGKELHDVVKAGTQGSSPTVKARFMETATHVASQLLVMATTPQEEKMWRLFAGMEVEASEKGALGDKESFGKHLHLKCSATGHIQLMQDWEWPYMYALADTGFHLAVQKLLGDQDGANTPRVMRILEIGWGQGISGRRLMDIAEKTAAGAAGLRVEYEVIELHPAVASDARMEMQRRPQGAMRVHEGPWQQVMPTLAQGNYDLVFYDPFNINPRYIGEAQQYEPWGLPVCVFEALQFHRLLRPGGVVVQYAISHRQNTSELLKQQVAPLFSELKLTRLAGCQPEVGTSYASASEANYLDVPALIK